MSDICDLNLYKTPSTEILQHRKEFYGLWKRCDDKTVSLFNRVQCQMDRCDFPPLISREYLLIDKFVCELNHDAREFICSVGTWTLMELNEYFFKRNKCNSDVEDSSTASKSDKAIHDDEQRDLSPLMIAVKCEFVSII